MVKSLKRSTIEDMTTKPKEPRSKLLTQAEEVAIIAFRWHMLLPLNDCLFTQQLSIPDLTRSALHHCLQRHGIWQLPDVEVAKPERQKFKRYLIGFFYIDIDGALTAEGRL